MPLTRRQRASTNEAIPPHHDENSDDDDEQSVPEEEEEPEARVWELDGTTFTSYQDFCRAKRERNQTKLMEIGLMEAVETLKQTSSKNKATQRGIANKRKAPAAPLPRRKSNRLAGVQAEGRYIEHETGGKLIIAGDSNAYHSTHPETPVFEEPTHYDGRINDGSDLSIQQAVELCDPKWWDESKSVSQAQQFFSQDLNVTKRRVKSPTSVVATAESSLSQKIPHLSVDDPHCVAKVTPDRIYSVACHPSPDKLMVCAGDKQGYVGLWNVDGGKEEDGEVHLWRTHTRPVSCLSWTPSGDALLSASYDGTVRWFDAASQTFQEIFATYDDSVEYRSHLGRGVDAGGWVQYVTPDPRQASEQCFFLATSKGVALHVDLRTQQQLTLHETLSDKKINTLSLHPNGHTLASAGLDCTVRLWDLRQMGDSRRRKNKKGPTPLATQQAGKSVNSAFFSPTGSRLLSTTMSNYLDVTHDAHLCRTEVLKATKRVRHDNHTGRWLSTFMAQWHPQEDFFVVGSMQKPRAMEVFDRDGKLLRAVQGESLTAVCSRCCFHPSTEKLVLVGGNSSGRVTIAR